MTKFETLIFIPEGSLLNEKAAERNALKLTLQELGQDFGPSERIKYTNLQNRSKFLGQEERIKLILKTFCDLNKNSAQIFAQKLQGQNQLVKDAIAFLDTVKGKTKLVLLAKESRTAISARLAPSELLNYFTATYTSDDFDSKLPDKAIFAQIFCEQTQLNPASSLVIGTNLADEIQGAENANIASLWLAPKKVKIPISPHPTLHLNKLSDLLFYLELS